MQTSDTQLYRKQSLMDSVAIWCTIDLLCLVMGFLFPALVADLFVPQADYLKTQFTMCACFTALGAFFLWGFDMYSIVLPKFRTVLVTMILSSVYSFLCTVLLTLFWPTMGGGFGLLAVQCLGGFALVLAWREILYYYHIHRVHRKKILMIEKWQDDNSRVRRMKYACLTQFDAWYEQVNVDDLDSVHSFINEYFHRYDVICLMESIPHEARDLFLNAGNAMGKELFVVPVMYEMNFVKIQLSALDDIMVFHLMPNQINPISLVVKRVIDITLALIGCVIGAIPMVILGILVKVTSPGPILYKQKRLTKGKKEFYIYKFRSMVQDAEKISGPILAQKDDDRITSVGRWMRRMRLDELPQLFNILKGDMSVVGPRPERPYFVEQYEKEIEDYDERFAVRAGLTALSHVYGRYSTDILDRTRYDILYVQNYSLLLDIKIILLTSRTIFLSDAAEGVTVQPQRTHS